MLRKIIKIDKEKCNGCGLCASACHEGAIAMEDGKAKLIRDDYCDGLGNCLPVCPTGAISFEEREAAAFDEVAVKQKMAEQGGGKKHSHEGGCPSMKAHAIKKHSHACEAPAKKAESQLNQWPVQIKLAPINAPYFDGAKLLIAADCTAFSYASFHEEFMKDHITLIGCPKLDEGDYAEKLTAILAQNNIKSVTVARMEVPCCGGMVNAVKTALASSGKVIPWHVVTISINGEIIESL